MHVCVCVCACVCTQDDGCEKGGGRKERGTELSVSLVSNAQPTFIQCHAMFTAKR